MKIKITLKDPDGISMFVQDTAKEQGIPEEDVWNALKKWVLWDEYITIDFDSETGSARVLESHK